MVRKIRNADATPDAATRETGTYPVNNRRETTGSLARLTGDAPQTYPEGTSPVPEELIVDAIKAMHERRSIRAYESRPVPRAVIEELLWAAVQAPTPPVSGPAPWAVCVLEDAQRLATYGARAKEYARTHQPEGKHWTWPERPEFEVFWDAPALVLICAKSGNPETPYDCCRAGQNLVVAAHARGIGTCWIGAPIPWLRSPGIAIELGLPQGYEAEVAITLGYPAETPSGAPRPRPAIHWLTPRA